jgi:hypothetical protein
MKAFGLIINKDNNMNRVNIIEREVLSMIGRIKVVIKKFNIEECEEYSKVVLVRYMNNDIDKLELDSTLNHINFRAIDAAFEELSKVGRMNALLESNKIIQDRTASAKIDFRRFK